MFQRVKNKFKELPAKFFLIMGIIFISVITAIPILLNFIDKKIDNSVDYKMVIERYKNCIHCQSITGENPKFERASYLSNGHSPRNYSYVINVNGINEKATIKSELEKTGNDLEITSWVYKHNDTLIKMD